MRTLTPSALSAALSTLPDAGPSGPRVVVAGNHAVPWEVLRLLDETVAEYRLFMLNAPRGVPDRAGVVLETPFVGAGMRDRERLEHVPARLSLVPARLSLVPALFAATRVPDVVVLHVSAPRDGTVSMGTEVNVLPAAVEAVRARGGLVVAQVNPRMPYTYGDGVLALEEVDLALEVDLPLVSPPVRPPDSTASAIGERVAALVADGATLQLGIGGVPDATLSALTGRRDLRVWTEMVSDGLLALARAGSLEQAATLTTSFLFGSQELYDWVDGNAAVRVVRTETTNDPALIAKQRRMTSINTALQVDLFAQANASRRPDRPGSVYSGFARPDRLHRRGPALHRRARRHRPAVGAPQGADLDGGPAAGGARDELPALPHRQRAGRRHGVELRPGVAGTPAGRPRRRPVRTRGTAGGGRPAGAAPDLTSGTRC